MVLRNLGIGTRLGAAFAIVLGIFSIVVAGSIYLTNHNKEKLLRGLGEANGKSVLVATMKSALLESGIAMRNMLDPGTVERQKLRVDLQNKRYAEAHDRFVQRRLTPAERQIIDELARLDKQIERSYGLTIRQAEALNSEGAATLITGHIDPINSKAVKEIDRLVELQQAYAQQVLDESVAADRQLMILLSSICTLTLAIGGVFSWFITRTITRPLNDAVAIASRVAVGDLTSVPRNVGQDEISQLIDALHRMNGSLGKIVGNVRRSVETIGLASREIAIGNADLSVRTERQAGSLEHTASSMEELTVTVKQNADYARQANRLVVTASDVARSGGEMVGRVVDTMASIKESSHKVVDIISVIDGIAFQTNILALNAAVEAARAGEQGRGFAVVASEVRSLAQRSAGAAKEIKSLITEAVGKIELGNGLVGHAGKTMKDIVSAVDEVAGIMNQINVISEKQSGDIEQAGQAIKQMEEMTQQNAALVEQAAAAAQSMRDQAETLEQDVAVFKHAPEDGVPAAAFKRPLTQG